MSPRQACLQCLQRDPPALFEAALWVAAEHDPELQPAQVLNDLHGLQLQVSAGLPVLPARELAQPLLRRLAELDFQEDDAGISRPRHALLHEVLRRRRGQPLALALIALHVFTIAMPFGVGPAAIQEIMPNSMRGQASAVYLFVITMVGLGIGPTAVALGTDFVFGDDNALRYSLLIVTTLAVLMSIILLAKSLKPYRESVTRLQQWAANPA